MSNRTSTKRKKKKKANSRRSTITVDTGTAPKSYPSPFIAGKKKSEPFVDPDIFTDNFVGEDARHQAQQLVYDAMEANDPEKAFSLIEKALELNPLCVDALMMLAKVTARTPLEYINLVQLVIRTAEMELGDDYFEENSGHFWELLETRPYMRACAALAEVLVDLGLLEDAIIEHEMMLDLNPTDNQGMRYPLLALYLREKRLDDAGMLVEQYQEDSMAVFAWGKVLLSFIQEGKMVAQMYLQDARELNPFMEAYLTGTKRLPENNPQYYGMGDENEAIISAGYLKPVWSKYPKALSWLKSMA